MSKIRIQKLQNLTNKRSRSTDIYCYINKHKNYIIIHSVDKQSIRSYHYCFFVYNMIFRIFIWKTKVCILSNVLFEILYLIHCWHSGLNMVINIVIRDADINLNYTKKSENIIFFSGEIYDKKLCTFTRKKNIYFKF